MKIAVLGAGNIGGTLGRKWAQAGHEVVFGMRDVGSAKVGALLEGMEGKAKADTVGNAIAWGEVVLFAIPYGAVAPTVAAHATALDGKIVIDATNSFGAPVVNNVGTILDSAPAAQVFRAFNSLGWEIFEDSGFAGVQADLFYCGPEGAAGAAVEGLIREVGLRPVRVGDLDQAPLVDSVGALWVQLAFRQGRGRTLAFKLLTR